MTKSFSIIIPHFNNAADLQRCLDSIPLRPDVEVIVVDDHSDPAKVDFDNFPGKGRENVRVIFSDGKNGKGPGYARNVGLEAACGEWILFSDSDDHFLTDELASQMDRWAACDADVVYFKVLRRSLDGNVGEYPLFNEAVQEAIETGDAAPISYGVPSPVAKFIRRSFLERNGIRFQAITCGDDITFSIEIANALKKAEICEASFYVVCDREGSLTRNNHWRSFYSYTKASCAAYSLMEPVGKGTLAYGWVASWWGRLWAENKCKALSLFPAVAQTMGFNKSLHCFKKAMKSGKWNWKKVA